MPAGAASASAAPVASVQQDAEDVYDFGGAGGFDDDAKASSARFLSVDDDSWISPDAEGESILEKLAKKATAAVEARKPLVKKREMKARFGGARAALADEEVGGMQGALDNVEAEFLRELQDNVPLSFLPPDVNEEDDEDDGEGAAPPFFFTEEVWEDIDYNQRKQGVVEQLEAASDRVSLACVFAYACVCAFVVCLCVNVSVSNVCACVACACRTSLTRRPAR